MDRRLSASAICLAALVVAAGCTSPPATSAGEPDEGLPMAEPSPQSAILFTERGLEHVDILFHLVNSQTTLVPLTVTFLNLTGTSVSRAFSVDFFTPFGFVPPEQARADGPRSHWNGYTGDRSMVNLAIAEHRVDAGPPDSTLWNALGFGFPSKLAYSTNVPTGEWYLLVGIERARADVRVNAGVQEPLLFEEMARDPGFRHIRHSTNHEDWNETLVAQAPASGAAIASTELAFRHSLRTLTVFRTDDAGPAEIQAGGDTCRSLVNLGPVGVARNFSLGTARVSYSAAKAPVPVVTAGVLVLALDVPLPKYVPGDAYLNCSL